ncbi:DUF4623 domain-containing protein [Pedobacter sp. UBA4863]|uniref:DUF4623 domain-containing protein n=1 Tax=Pedobacter sp. UBA4863 TaxID=1947060 RepID=UPI0025DC2A6A|nr:DUF4623 domain-containing protein [Pedobacter sp. UBA4863]
MKLIYKTQKIRLLAAFISLLAIAACKDNLPEPMDTSANVTVLNSIKIINTGANGDVVLNGIVDEDAKTVSFPRIDTLTKDPITGVYNLKIEAQVSNGAVLEKEFYPITFEQGESEKIVVAKVMNSPRFREYLLKLRLKVPVYGADFDTYATYDFSNNPLGQPTYSAFGGTLTRGSGFDGQHVLVIQRLTVSTQSPHLLSVDELKNGVINKIMLNTTGITGGTYAVNMGAQVNGHTYIANLSSNAPTNPVKIYHWTNPNVAPQLIASIDISGLAGAGIRHGDNFSASLDDQGNGFFFFGDNAGAKILRFNVANYTTVTNPTVFGMPLTGAGAWSSYNRIGNTSEYLFTGHPIQLVLANDGGAAIYTTSKMTTLAKGTSFPLTSSDVRIVNFNGERYLITVTAPIGTGSFANLRVYNITKGKTVKDALANLENLPAISPIFDYPLMGPTVNAAAAAQTGFYVKKDGLGKDEKLMLYAASTDGGFAFFEFGKKVATD